MFHFLTRYCDIFPTVNIKGTLKHLQLTQHELNEYEVQVERILRRYLKRLQWLLSGTDHVFWARDICRDNYAFFKEGSILCKMTLSLYQMGNSLKVNIVICTYFFSFDCYLNHLEIRWKVDTGIIVYIL